jgi:hypothetical protein
MRNFWENMITKIAVRILDTGSLVKVQAIYESSTICSSAGISAYGYNESKKRLTPYADVNGASDIPS